MNWRRSLRLAFIVLTFACATEGLAADVAATGDTRTGDAATAPARRPFEPSEELVYEAEFSKLLLRGINIAEFKFTAGRAPAASVSKVADNAPAVSVVKSANASSADNETAAAPLLFTGDIVSRGWFRKLFGINFHYRVESTVESKSFQIMRTTKLDEQGKRVRTSEAVFDRAADKITWTELDPNNTARPPRVVSSPLADASHDIITAIYFLRTQKLVPGQTFELSISDSGAVYRVPVKVLAEKKRFKSIVGRVAVVRVEIEIFGKGRLIEQDGRMSIWMTNDERHLPIRARFDGDLGTLDINLKSINKNMRL